MCDVCVDTALSILGLTLVSCRGVPDGSVFLMADDKPTVEIRL